MRITTVLILTLALMQAFGLRAATSYSNNSLTLNYPTPQTCLTVLDGKPYQVLVGGEGGTISLVDIATGQVKASFPYPVPSRIVTASPVPPPYTVGRYLLLPYGSWKARRNCAVTICRKVLQRKRLASLTISKELKSILPTADGLAVYLLKFYDEKPVVEKRALVDGTVQWRSELPGVSVGSNAEFIAEQDGSIALFSAENTDEGISDPAEVILLNAENGKLRARYRCGLKDAVPKRLPHWLTRPANVRAILNTDDVLYAGTYGQGLWRTYDGKAWSRNTGAGLPTYLVSLGDSRHGDIAAGTYMQDGLASRSYPNSLFHLLAWPKLHHWPGWWSREFSRCMTVGYCGDTLYVQTFGGMLRWSPNAGWERTAILAGIARTVIDDSGIWTAYANGKKVRIWHYSPAGVCNLASDIPASAEEVDALVVDAGHLLLVLADRRILSATPAEIRRHTMHEIGRMSREMVSENSFLGNSFFVYHEPGGHSAFIIGTPQGPMVMRNGTIAMLDPSLAGYADAFTTYRDRTGEWLVICGKHGVLMLPTSIIGASLGGK